MDHLSFVGSQFGGVAADGSGLAEQKRVLFGSLDILSSDLAACEFLLSSLLNDNGTSALFFVLHQVAGC